MNDLVFEYKRGDTFSVKIVVNTTTATVTYHAITYPDNCPEEVKKRFLEEAEKAVEIKLAELDDQGVMYGH